jgi:hypothetical protein
MAQNEQRRSQPLASLSGATGLSSRRRRTTAGPPAWPGRPMSICPGSTARARSTGLIGRSLRRSPGVWLAGRSPPSTAASDSAGSRRRRSRARRRPRAAARRAARRTARRGTRPPRPSPRVGGTEQGVDRVLLGALDEPAGVHDDDVGALLLVDELPARAVEPAGQLLGVDLVAGAAQGDEGDTAGGWHPPSLLALQAPGRAAQRHRGALGTWRDGSPAQEADTAAALPIRTVRRPGPRTNAPSPRRRSRRTARRRRGCAR